MYHSYDFLPQYPEFESDTVEILGEKLTNNPTLATWDIFKKKEFHDFRLLKTEHKPSNPGQYMNHQEIVSRFLSSHTPQKGILIFHEPGTGKTCTSVASIEKIKNENSSYKGALIIMKGQGLVNNYKNELVYVCTDNVYVPSEYETEGEKLRRMNKKISEYYQFETFEVFSKMVSNSPDAEIIKKYSNLIICIDEVHNLRLTNEKSQYNSVHRFLHLVKDCKVIIMSGTPMRDQPEEIAPMINLILPLNRQLPTGAKFVENYLIPSGDSMILKPSMVDDLKSYFWGNISYLRTMQSDVKREFVGKKLLNYFNLYTVPLQSFQENAYQEAYMDDLKLGDVNNKGKAVYINSRQAGLFVFPDGSWGSRGFGKYIKLVKNNQTGGSSYYLDKILIKELSGGTVEDRLNKLRKYSAKYADCIEKILTRDEVQLVFIDSVEGGGAILFSKLLELFGLSKSVGAESTQKPRYSLITGKSSHAEIKKIFEDINKPKNMLGKYTKVIVGSEVMGEGFTVKNNQSIYILVPYWNFGKIEQAMARGLRLFSHRDLENAGIDVMVKIHLYCIETDNSIDQYMYKTSEDKDISIKSIERAMKESSFDCPLNRERNILPITFDGMRECDYKTCDYQCDNIRPEKFEEEFKLDLSTYNLFYDFLEIEEIQTKIKNLFINRSYLSIQEDILEPFTQSHQLFTIMKAMEGLRTVNDSLGYSCVVGMNGDNLYLSYNLLDGNFLDNYYVDNFPLHNELQFKRESELVYSNNLPNLLEKLKENPKLSVFQKFSLNAQEMMLELAVKSLDSGSVMDCDGLRQFILKNIDSYLIEFENTKVSILKKDNLRCFDKKTLEWDDCDDEYEQKVSSLTEGKKTSLEDNKYGYYGIVESKTGKFSIRDVTDKSKIKNSKKKSEITRGVNCEKSWSRDKLIRLVDLMKFDYKDDEYKKYETNEELVKLLKDNKYKDVYSSYPTQELVKKSREDIIRILYWGHQKKGPICQRIKKWFEEHELIDNVVHKN